MSSPERQARVDSYGKPLPELADIRRAVTALEPTNQAKLALLHALVEDVCRAVMRRGWYGTVQMHFTVEDGIVQRDVFAGLERRWNQPPEAP